MTKNHNQKATAYSERGRVKLSRATKTFMKIKEKNPARVYATGGSKGKTLRQFSNDMAKAGYWSSRKAGNSSVQMEANRIYGRLVNKLDSKVGYKTLPFDVLWTAIRSCKLELNSWVSKRDVMNVYLGLPRLKLVYKDEDTFIYKRTGGQK